MGQQITFVTADSMPEAILQGQGFPVIVFNTDYTKPEQELSVWREMLIAMDSPLIIVDSYFVTDKYLMELRRIGKLVLMEDFGGMAYPADVLINYNIYSKQLSYDMLYSQNTMLLLGCSYVPLREEFIKVRRRGREAVMKVLITAGGADEYNIAGALLQRLRIEPDLKSLILHVVAGPLNKNILMLEQLSANDPNIHIHRNVTDMAGLMQRCDIAISAGGSTLYELCACGVPTVSFSYVDNQLQGVKEFHRSNLIYYAGDMRSEAEATLDKIVIQLLELCRNTELRTSLTMQMQELVDGFGAHRIAEKLLMIL
jgi:UDP-2,4-diacetamido-2,4,6-trideoxy-beta-L-altropyranose hydrolase